MATNIELTEAAKLQPTRHLSRVQKTIIIVALIIAALILAIPVANWASDPVTHASTIQSLDAKTKDVMAMTASSAAASAGIAAIPGGFGSTIATKLIDVTSGFAVVLGALYLEKYLLTILCLAALRIAAPVAAIAAAVAVAFWENDHARAIASKAAAKLALVALAMVLVIPTSVFISNFIENTYNTSAMAAIESSESLPAVEGGQAEQSAVESSETTSSEQDSTTQSGGLLDKLRAATDGALSEVKNVATGAAGTITQGVQDAVSEAESALNQMIEKMVMMIIVDCVIPILVVVFYIWLVNLILGTSFKLSNLPIGKTTAGIKSAVRARKEDGE